MWISALRRDGARSRRIIRELGLDASAFSFRGAYERDRLAACDGRPGLGPGRDRRPVRGFLDRFAGCSRRPGRGRAGAGPAGARMAPLSVPRPLLPPELLPGGNGSASVPRRCSPSCTARGEAQAQASWGALAGQAGA
ncbi:hypothetical protein ACU686_31120 [Yinghuangia aomiensis]